MVNINTAVFSVGFNPMSCVLATNAVEFNAYTFKSVNVIYVCYFRIPFRHLAIRNSPQ